MLLILSLKNFSLLKTILNIFDLILLFKIFLFKILLFFSIKQIFFFSWLIINLSFAFAYLFILPCLSK